MATMMMMMMMIMVLVMTVMIIHVELWFGRCFSFVKSLNTFQLMLLLCSGALKPGVVGLEELFTLLIFVRNPGTCL